MTTILCTLYNSLYLDKGLVLYDSLCECAKDFKLYVLCMDDKCYEVLKDLHQEYHIPIRLSDFEKDDKELLLAKSNRTFGEYCWTCSSSLIRYIISRFKCSICTYIDADMFFYSDPQILVDEMLFKGKDVMITPHRFSKKKKYLARTVGEYCVEFNTFTNTIPSIEALNYWRDRCIEVCSNIGDGIHWGDQKYLEELKSKFACVYVCKHEGAGVATWNIENKELISKKKHTIKNIDGTAFPIVFFHFASIRYYSKTIISINIRNGNKNIDYSLVDYLYFPYLMKIKKKQRFLLTNYDLNIMIRPTKGNLWIRRKIFQSKLYNIICKNGFLDFLHLPLIYQID